MQYVHLSSWCHLLPVDGVRGGAGRGPGPAHALPAAHLPRHLQVRGDDDDDDDDNDDDDDDDNDGRSLPAMKRYTKILGLGLGVLNSGTVLLLATLYPGTSPPFMLILGYEL